MHFRVVDEQWQIAQTRRIMGAEKRQRLQMRPDKGITLQACGRRLNNRIENLHLPFQRRERAMQRFRLMRSLQKSVSVHASIFNHFKRGRA